MLNKVMLILNGGVQNDEFMLYFKIMIQPDADNQSYGYGEDYPNSRIYGFSGLSGINSQDILEINFFPNSTYATGLVLISVSENIYRPIIEANSDMLDMGIIETGTKLKLISLGAPHDGYAIFALDKVDLRSALYYMITNPYATIGLIAKEGD